MLNIKNRNKKRKMQQAGAGPACTGAACTTPAQPALTLKNLGERTEKLESELAITNSRLNRCVGNRFATDFEQDMDASLGTIADLMKQGDTFIILMTIDMCRHCKSAKNSISSGLLDTEYGNASNGEMLPKMVVVDANKSSAKVESLVPGFTKRALSSGVPLFLVVVSGKLLGQVLGFSEASRCAQQLKQIIVQ
jgi:hypothetical protein